LKEGNLPEDSRKSQEVVTLALSDGVLYHVNPKTGELPQIVVPTSLQQQIMEDTMEVF